MPSRRSRITHRYKRVAATLAVLAIFAVALALWVGGSGGGAALPNALSTPTSGSGGANMTPSDGVTPSGSVTGGAGLAALPALTGGGATNSTILSTLGPGKHVVILTATSDKPLLSVSYVVKGDAKGKAIYNVKSPVVITRTVSGQRPYAAIGLQVGPNGTTGSCRVAIDGKVVDTKRVNAAFAVMLCLA